ncbi:DoxX family protein [Actinomadura madurae]|uniref:DoxX family protein n=1 Tax=Actinomadura madurae TaxID=1993 RepID=UPI0020263EDC|nr:DoxX family protein [Actinomadura madurae]URM93936.1 DoxX family protein [Actinomadura madurae]
MKNRRQSRRPSSDGDLARLILRGAIAGTMIAHGVRHGRTLDGTAGWFSSIGFRQPRLQAQLSSVVEIGSGAAVAVGALTPLSTAAIVGTMGVAYQTVHRPNGYFIVSEGWEYVAFISAAATALSALGSGRFSLDRALGADKVGTPLTRAFVTVLVGAGGAAGQLAGFWRRPEPEEA